MPKNLVIAGIVLVAGIAVTAGLLITNAPKEASPAQEQTQEQKAIQKNTNSAEKKKSMKTVTLETSRGTIVFEAFEADAPKTVKNFTDLVEKGFYNGLTFHRVIPDFMIQGGDPKGNGTGGPGYKFEDELNPSTQSYKEGYKRGVVAMANAGPNTNGSQFFILHKDYPLPHNYTIFGKVVKGIEVIDAIAAVQTDSSDKPLTPVTITKASVQIVE